MTSQQDQKNEISTPDGDVEEQAAGLSAGHAFWRQGGAADDIEAEPGDTAAGPADDLAEPADPKAEQAEDLAVPDEDLDDDDEDLDDDDEDLAEPDEDLVEEDDEIIVADPDDVVVAEVIDEEPAQTPGSADPTEAADVTGTDIGQPQVAGTAPVPAERSADTRPLQASVPAAAPAGQAARTELGQEWRDIQAAFVDDPRGAVRLAAEATDEALNGVIDSLRSRLDGLSAASSDSPEHRDTEQLRGELRQYRVLCQNLAEIQRRWAEPQPA